MYNFLIAMSTIVNTFSYLQKKIIIIKKAGDLEHVLKKFMH